MATFNQLSAWVGRTAVVIDAPHCGSHYPPDFDFACDFRALRKAEDTHCDSLWNFAPGLGAAFVTADFARTYMNLNADLAAVTALLRDGAWPHELQDDEEGVLVARRLDDGTSIYARELTVHEVQARLGRCWLPYHTSLASAVEAAYRRHGHVLHLNCYSMPSLGPKRTDGTRAVNPDMLLCDGDGQTADTGITQAIAGFLEDKGYMVGLNSPCKSLQLIRRHGGPRDGRHSLQVLVNKRLYMDEDSLDLHRGLLTTRRALMDMTELIVRGEVAAMR